jgi:hypothetical protein
MAFPFEQRADGADFICGPENILVLDAAAQPHGRQRLPEFILDLFEVQMLGNGDFADV